jgi:hypothetical protein
LTVRLFLTKCQGSNPNRNEAVLPERKAIIWMSDDVKEKASVPPFINELIVRNRPKRNAAKDKWPGIKRNILLSLPALFSDKEDRVDLLEAPGGHADAGQDRTYISERTRVRSGTFLLSEEGYRHH